jgi:glutaredoxin-like protein
MIYGVIMVLSDKDKQALKKLLDPIEEEVKILFFRSDEPSCQYCDVIEELLSDIRSANDKVVYDVLDVSDPLAKKFGVKHGPTILFEKKPNIWYMGIPSGHEFRPFIDDIVLMGTGKFDMDPHVREIIEQIDVPLEFWIFVTPSCPYCPWAVKSAHRFAYVNPNVKGVMIEAIEYSDLADKYEVSAVPKNVVIDGETGETLLAWEGAMPEDAFAHQLFHAYQHKKGVEHEH